MTESIQYERDLRSASKEWRRTKESSVKWSQGSRPLAGVRRGEPEDARMAPEHMYAKRRPEKMVTPTKEMKLAMGLYSRNRRVPMYERSDIQDAVVDSSPDLLSPGVPPPDAGVLYSFDRADTPGRPLTLDVFVKNTGGKETEKLVEREYEVLDGNGEAVKGRKARAVLRKSRSSGTAAGAGEGRKDGEQEGVEVEDGFELI
ncbi:hypothetical protein MYCTH_2299139 [Thermothelomyces thermophilus ATCC 42464]|uniref:Uncharacterized protein n=1 Tax=Thermothelomyces thermophilus (strain ATCC 42464 / BCRC 31852 / DSM 1799) TaxID=573729 RepID=G2Q4T9_THET4|nr:uncharacterized protein MYCTH_2299139 [Thermothelomyces thermophilus ATCC 42464]AEO55378.1 hypothetical protein MYCTH_2299139 [Thermothelomyces thermophilus ATCC 42464]